LTPCQYGNIKGLWEEFSVSGEELDQPETRRLLEGLVAVLQAFRDEAPRISVAQVQATLVTALETMDTTQGERLPNVSDYAERLKLSPSGASRLMSNLSTASDEAKAPLVEAERGSGARRSEAFVLTDTGRSLVARVVEVISGRTVKNFDTHDFLSFALARHGGTSGENVRVKLIGPKTLLVSPRRDALSSEIREWCADHHLKLPTMKAVAGGIEMEFATENEATEFRLRW
jgi:DNA-binding MarR family transcriptional regulator